MTPRNVDLVVAGDSGASLAAIKRALDGGQRVLVVLRSDDSRVRARLRRCLCRSASDRARLMVMTNAEVVCADGVTGIEAVVIRDLRSGRLSAVNASAFVGCAE
jgi:hypothetical protein